MSERRPYRKPLVRTVRRPVSPNEVRPGSAGSGQPPESRHSPAAVSSCAPATDRELVERTLAGDRAAWGELARRYRPLAVRMLCEPKRSRLLLPRDVDDVVQEALAGLPKALARYPHPGACVASLVTRALDRHLTMSRTGGAYRERTVPLDGGGAAARRAISNPEAEASRREALRLVSLALRRLRPSLRRVLVLRAVEDLVPSEIAARLSITPDSAVTMTRMARRHLEQEFGGKTDALALAA